MWWTFSKCVEIVRVLYHLKCWQLPPGKHCSAPTPAGPLPVLILRGMQFESAPLFPVSCNIHAKTNGDPRSSGLGWNAGHLYQSRGPNPDQERVGGLCYAGSELFFLRDRDLLSQLASSGDHSLRPMIQASAQIPPWVCHKWGREHHTFFLVTRMTTPQHCSSGGAWNLDHISYWRWPSRSKGSGKGYGWRQDILGDDRFALN